MKTRLLAVLILVLFILPLVPFAQGAVTTIPSRYARTLPTNTVYFDDFQQGTNQWAKTIVGTSTSTNVIQNSTISFDGNSSLGIYNPNANTQVIATKRISVLSTTIGIQVWTAYNLAMSATDDGQAPEFGFTYYTPDTNAHQVLVEYRPALGQWVLFGNQNSANSANTPLVLYTFTGFHTAKNGYYAYNDPTWGQGWYWAKIVVNTAANRYLSFCTSVGCFANATAFVGTAGSSGNHPDATDIAMRLQITNDASTVLSNALFSDLLITDETGVVPNIIQFGLVGASSIFAIIVVATGMMYMASGIALVQRVFRQKVNSPLTSPKFIITTGVAGTVGFLIMIIIGAGFAQNCPSGFTCVG